ncbi:MAG TPA: hypothetical protein VNI78_02460 [Vicinamibacterales bacterium]|nr:hypothetical protein [Vicinamibacterales bacterium]
MRIVFTLTITAALPFFTAPAEARQSQADRPSDRPAARALNPDANPLAALNDELKRVLAAAGVPFSDEQERAIALMMEERRRASEELFGNLMDFRGGPTQGQEADRLRSAIEWMRGEYLRLLANYLTPEQDAAWQAHLTAKRSEPGPVERAASAASETQYVRLNNNVFTAENPGYGGGDGRGNFQGGGNNQGTEVIQRGGVGAWHGNAQFLIKDDALNARNAFAGNKPPYQERRLAADVSGPTVPGRLTTAIGFNQTKTENVTTIRATLPEGIYALGITRPNTFRNLQLRNVLQLADQHSVRTFARYATETSRDQGIGDFTLPERRYDQFRRQFGGGIFPFSALSSRSLLEFRLELFGNENENVPFSEAVQINVLDAFNRGGAQNRSETSNRNYQFGNLFTHVRGRVTLKTGIEGAYRQRRSVSTNNFGGAFTFSSLEAFLGGRPLTFRITRGNPRLEVSQLEMSGFLQADVTFTPQLSVLLGVRYDAQENLDDYDNIAPRLAVAYAPSPATVIRAGGGIFYDRFQIDMLQNQRRFSGTHQYEIVIDNPSYPDPFAGGTLRQTLPSVRVTDPHLAAPYNIVGMISLERTFFTNLLLTVTYDLQREYNRFRMRNLNAPYDATSPVLRACRPELPAEACVKPDPTRGHVFNLESTGREIRHALRLSARKRFSIFNGTVTYQLQRAHGDVQGGDGTLASDSYNLRADWGRAPWPLHTINGNLNARLPLGVFLNGAVSYNSGRYYTITTGRDDNRDSNVNDRPPGVPPNSLRGPQYLNWDFNLSKAFFFRRAPGSATSGTNMNVFVNMTNAFNHVHYGVPSGVMTSPNFRRSTSASNPREIEAGVRFQF